MHDCRPAAALLGLGLVRTERDLLRGTLSASAHTAEKHVGTLEFFDAFSHSKRKPAHVESKTSQISFLCENKSALSDVRQLSREGVRDDRKDENTDGAVDRSHRLCWPCYDHMFNLSEMVQRSA